MCSKKCAKPDLPGSTSLREPVCTGMCTETRFGNPVGTTITLRPFGSVRSAVGNGNTSGFAGGVLAWAAPAKRPARRARAGIRMSHMMRGPAASSTCNLGRADGVMLVDMTATGPSDDRVVALVRGGDARLFELIMRRHNQ